MTSVLDKVRKEIVIVAGIAAAALNWTLTNGGVLSAIIPLVVAVLTRTQTSPVGYVQELLDLIGSLRKRPVASTPPKP